MTRFSLFSLQQYEFPLWKNAQAKASAPAAQPQQYQFALWKNVNNQQHIPQCVPTTEPVAQQAYIPAAEPVVAAYIPAAEAALQEGSPDSEAGSESDSEDSADGFDGFGNTSDDGIDGNVDANGKAFGTFISDEDAFVKEFHASGVANPYRTPSDSNGIPPTWDMHMESEEGTSVLLGTMRMDDESSHRPVMPPPKEHQLSYKVPIIRGKNKNQPSVSFEAIAGRKNWQAKWKAAARACRNQQQQLTYTGDTSSPRPPSKAAATIHGPATQRCFPTPTFITCTNSTAE